MQKMKVLAQFDDPLIKILRSKNCQKFGCFLAILRGKKNFLQIDSKWSETRKKHEIGETEFFPVAGAGSRRSTDFTSRGC